VYRFRQVTTVHFGHAHFNHMIDYTRGLNDAPMGRNARPTARNRTRVLAPLRTRPRPRAAGGRLSIDPNPYEVTEPELLRGLWFSWRGGFLPDHPGFSVVSHAFRIGHRALLVPPRSDRVSRIWTSIVTSTRLLHLDPRLPPRPRALKPARSTPRRSPPTAPP